MEWSAGTSGYSYKEWKGSFYSDDIAANAMLAHYASRLPAVEINNTFYRMPRPSVLANWRDAVPANFRFVIKASRRITHQAKLANCEDATGHLAELLETLGEKLGGVLFQLPPYLRKDIALLDAFLAAWPTRLPAAVEFRQAGWFDDETADVLARHGAAICVSDDGKLALPTFFGTVDWVYFRLRRADYQDADLQRWLERGSATGARRGFAFFKHEDEGAGPRWRRGFYAPPGAGDRPYSGCAGASPKALKTAMNCTGSTGTPPTRTVQCRWAPLARPV